MNDASDGERSRERKTRVEMNLEATQGRHIVNADFFLFKIA